MATSHKIQLCNYELSQLKKRVEPPLAVWVKQKLYLRHQLTYAVLSTQADVPCDDLKKYFKYVFPAGMHAWLAELRVEYAKELLIISDSRESNYLYYRAGFQNEKEFNTAFYRIEGVAPSVWRKEHQERIMRGEDPSHIDLTNAINKVMPAWESWTKNRKIGAPPRSQSLKHLSVTEKEFDIFCAIVLDGRIQNILDEMVISDAKKVLQENPRMSIDVMCYKIGVSSPFAFKTILSNLTGKGLDEWLDSELPIVKESVTSVIPPKFDIEPVEEWKTAKGFCHPKLNQKEAAHALGFSEIRFAQYLREIEKTTFASWIAKLRLEEAKRLLKKNPSLSINDISLKIGLSKKEDLRGYIMEYLGISLETWLKG